MARLQVRPEAELDLLEAGLWYEGEREGLGVQFLDAVRATLRRVEQGPLQFPAATADLRRALVHRFPFGVFFILESDVATVVAVMHLHRHPSSWERRA